MIDIGSSNFLINVPSLPVGELEIYSSTLFDSWEESVAKTLTLPDYSLALKVEEGSIKGKGAIAATAGAIFIGIGSYGDFISGLETINSQVSTVTSSLFESARSPFGCTSSNSKVRRNTGALGRLHSLFDQVKSGKMSPEQAMLATKELFGNDSDETENFIKELKTQFEEVPLYPEQLSFESDDWKECEENKVKPPKRKPNKPKPQPTPIIEQYRIEIWRESKKSKKRVKIIKK